MTIRPATYIDEQECKRLFLEYCAAVGVTGDAGRFWYLRPQEPNGVILVMDEEGTLVGFVCLLVTPMAVDPYAVAMPQMFYVDPAWRDLSWRLMRAGMAYFRARGLRQMTMLCADRLQPFWAKHKFTPSLTMMTRDVPCKI